MEGAWSCDLGSVVWFAAEVVREFRAVSVAVRCSGERGLLLVRERG